MGKWFCNLGLIVFDFILDEWIGNYLIVDNDGDGMVDVLVCYSFLFVCVWWCYFYWDDKGVEVVVGNCFCFFDVFVGYCVNWVGSVDVIYEVIWFVVFIFWFYWVVKCYFWRKVSYYFVVCENGFYLVKLVFSDCCCWWILLKF